MTDIMCYMTTNIQLIGWLLATSRKTHLAVKRLAGEIDAAEIAPRNTSILDGPIIVILSVIFGVLVMLQYDTQKQGYPRNKYDPYDMKVYVDMITANITIA